MSAEDFSDAELNLTDEQGNRRTVKWNEPRPARPTRPSTTVEPERLGLAGVRLRAEAILAKSCGPAEFDALRELGPAVGPILVKMAVKRDDCEPYCQQRAGAIGAIGRLGVAEGVEPLRGLAADPNESQAVRAQATLALGRIGSDMAIEFLTHVLATYKSAAARRAAAKGLGESGNLRGVAALEQAVAKDADTSVRRQAHAGIVALEKLHGVKLADMKAPPAVPPRGRPVRNQRAEERFQRGIEPRGR